MVYDRAAKLYLHQKAIFNEKKKNYSSILCTAVKRKERVIYKKVKQICKKIHSENKRKKEDVE